MYWEANPCKLLPMICLDVYPGARASPSSGVTFGNVGIEKFKGAEVGAGAADRAPYPGAALNAVDHTGGFVLTYTAFPTHTAENSGL